MTPVSLCVGTLGYRASPNTVEQAVSVWLVGPQAKQMTKISYRRCFLNGDHASTTETPAWFPTGEVRDGEVCTVMLRDPQDAWSEHEQEDTAHRSGGWWCRLENVCVRPRCQSILPGQECLRNVTQIPPRGGRVSRRVNLPYAPTPSSQRSSGLPRSFYRRLPVMEQRFINTQVMSVSSINFRKVNISTEPPARARKKMLITLPKPLT
ncbi:uncharacterized protein LOC111556348 [Felis catus]|uniref:uncharacterized protein LOC111556348 n=1 Tax=Felis catus TaxID=9685 RepID=UPI001D19D19B|nr:uncharacterized protein LOC111556348 [Felis catus]